MTKPEHEKIWYLPHHPVQNPNKPGKIRRVANAASKYRGQSLNSNLLTGPDLLNSLLGILLRFREHPVAILADIESMFMQIAVKQEDQSALRFLWSKNDFIMQYQFTRLIFGATCSPSMAIFVLIQCAKDNAENFPKAFAAITKQFYMDDYVHSLPTITEAKDTVMQVKECLQRGDFKLTKFLSDCPEVLEQNPFEGLDESKDFTRVLGQKWNFVDDKFFIKPMDEFPKNAAMYKRRKLLSLVASIFDPIGIASPVTIRFNIVMQQIWQLGLKWDTPLPEKLHKPLQKILNSYFESSLIEHSRALSFLASSQEIERQLHVFVDASTCAMAAIIYLRSYDDNTKQTETSFIISKCKVTPLKSLSVPKLELEAAIIGIRLMKTVHNQKLHKTSRNDKT